MSTGSFGAVLELTSTRLLRSGKARVAAAFALVPPALVVGARWASEEADAAAALEAGLRWAFFSLVVLALPFVFGAGVFAEEVEHRTIGYTLGRPVPRPVVALARVTAVWLVSAGFLVAGILVLHVGLFATDPAALAAEAPTTLRGLGALLLLLGYYAALTSFWSAAVPDAAFVLSALHLGFVELFFGWAPGVLRLISAGYVAGELAGLDRVGLMADSTPDVPLWALGVALVVWTVVATVLVVGVVRFSELRVGKA